MKTTTLFIWILCLATLAVGAKNFEMGLSVDAPFYAAVARNIARTGELFDLHGSVPEYRPFIYHPPLGLWLLAGVFKVLPAADWSARIPSQIFYVLFLLLFFAYVRKKANEKTAVWTIILLWTWYRFSNYFSNVYLDPGTLFLGTASVVVADLGSEKKKLFWGFVSGVFLGLAILYKGLAIGGFFPIWAAAVLIRKAKDFPFYIRFFSLAGIGVLLIVIPFLVALSQSKIPNYLTLYWDYQMIYRIGPEWRLSQIFNGVFWWRLFRDTLYLFPLAFFSLRKTKWKRLYIPLIGSFAYGGILLFSNLGGAQYWVYLLPWLAWLIADTLTEWIKIPHLRLVKASQFLAVAAIMVIQFLPIQIHGSQPSADELEVAVLSRQGRITHLILDTTPHRVDVTITSRYAWYGDLEVAYATENPLDAPSSIDKTVYVHYFRDEKRANQLKAKGWCRHLQNGERSLWLKCSR